MASEKTCFFIAPIGDEGSADRERSDQVRDFVIKPALEKSKYAVTRADEISKSGIITSQIIQNIFDADLVIAYLATNNPNVFYELALRHVVRKPFIQIIEEGQKIPFDVSGLRTIQFRYGDLRSAENCKVQIQKQVEALEKSPEDVESPVTQAIDVKALRDSNKPIEQALARVMEMVEALRGEIAAARPAVPQMSMPQLSFLSPSITDSIQYADAPVNRSFTLSNLVDPTLMARAVATAAGKPKLADAPAEQPPMNPTKKGQK